MIRSPLWVTLLCPVVALCLTATGCSQDSSNPEPPAATAGIDLKPDTTGAKQEPGALASATTLPTLDRRLLSATSLAARIEYTSTSGITDGRTQVTATVFVPRGTPPQGGWPIIVYGHATTGIQSECAPSLSPTLLGASTPIAALVKAGYLVTVPDYQGLGLDTSEHPYLDSTTVGYNVIDSVRAARRLVADASDRWLVAGVSQGGQAAWAANELATNYGQGLSMIGAVSLSPPTDLTGFAELAAAGTLTKDQQASLQLILAALATEHPDLPLDDYRRGVVAQKWDVLSSCETSTATQRNEAIEQIGPDDLRPSGPDQTAVLAGYLQQRGLPQAPTAAPMLVVYGGADSFLPGSWTDRALTAACTMGDVIDIQFQPDKGHSDIDVSMAFGWINERFAGQPAANSCESFIAAQQPAEEPGTTFGDTGESDSGADEFGEGE
jgi:pimeloyl-ACP methyl ester carboxylesterase